MKSYSKNSICIKCGNSSGILSQFKTYRREILSQLDGHYHKTNVEVIERVCPNCSYKWEEEPLDGLTTKEKENGR